MVERTIRLTRARVRYTLRLLVNHCVGDRLDEGEFDEGYSEFLVDLRAGGAVTSEGWSGYTGAGRYLLYGGLVDLESDDNVASTYTDSLAIVREQAEEVLSRAEVMLRDEGADLITMLGTFAETGEGPARSGDRAVMEQWRTAMRDRTCCQVWFAPGNGESGGSDRFHKYSALADRAEEMGLLLVSTLWRECARP